MRAFAIIVLASSVLCAESNSRAQASENPLRISYSSRGQSLMTAITAVSLLSHSPVGIVLGTESDRLCKTSATFDIVDSPPDEALGKITRLAGYTISYQDGVSVLLPPDLPDWESVALAHRFVSTPRQQDVTISGLGVTLTGWIQMDIGHIPTFAASVMSSPGDKNFNLPEMKNVTISQIANRIVTLPGGGIWILRPAVPVAKSVLDVELRSYSYADNPDQIQSLGCGRVAHP